MQTNNERQARRVLQRDIDGFVTMRKANIARGSDPTMSKGNAVGQGGLDNIQKPAKVQSPKVTESIPHFDLPRYKPRERPIRLVRKRDRWFKTAMRTTMALGILIVLAGGYAAWHGYMSVHKVFRGTGTVAALSTEKVAPELLKGEGDGRVNILLLGIGGENHPGGDLTDTIMVLSVDPVNKTAAMLSVPRDLWVKMPVNYFGAYQKLNAAYSSAKYKYLGKVDLASTDERAVEAGFNAADQVVSDVLGININYHILVNFQAFRQAVDSVNGVSIDVKTQLYDPTMAWENNNNPVLAAIGVQNMGGKQALNYARSRETSSDFARGERQRQLLVALKEKVLTLGTLSDPSRITSLISAFGSNVQTDLSTQAASRLFTIVRGISSTDMSSLSLTTPLGLVTTDHVGAISVVRPKAGFNTYSDIQAYVRSQLKDGYLVKEKANVYVVGASDTLRTQTEQTLKDYGYVVSGSAVVTGLRSGTTVVDKSDGKAPYTLHYLQDRYELIASKILPVGVEVPNGTQFVIIAGT